MPRHNLRPLVTAVGAPAPAPISVTESAWLPYSFQRDQYLCFVWPKAPGCSLDYRLSLDGLIMFVKINRAAVDASNPSLAPHGNLLPMGIPKSEVEFKMVLPHKCSPLGSQRLVFNSSQLEGIQLVRDNGVTAGHCL